MKIVFRRILIAIPTLLLLSFLIFALLELTPGDVSSTLLDPSATAEQQEALREELGLNRPLLVRYVDYIGDVVLQGDMGVSARSGQPVMQEIAIRLPYTLSLVMTSVSLAIIIGGSLGIISAYRQGTIWDYLITGGISIGMAVPVFWLALMLVSVFSLRLRWLPVFGSDSIKHLILPSVCTAFVLIPGITRLTRASLLDTFGSDFILFARSKGLRSMTIFRRHISPVAAISIVTYVGLQMVRLIGSAAIMEIIFSWPGLGGLAINAAFERDPLLLQGVTLTIASLTFIVLFFVDLLVIYLDPRITKQAI